MTTTRADLQFQNPVLILQEPTLKQNYTCQTVSTPTLSLQPKIEKRHYKFLPQATTTYTTVGSTNHSEYIRTKHFKILKSPSW